MEVANIEKYMPTVYQAEILVKNNLEMYRHKGEKAFKIIHGYGSTGKGGALRTGIRRYLKQLKGVKIIAVDCDVTEDSIDICDYVDVRL